MTEGYDDRDRELMRALQEGVALVDRPYQVIADRIGWSEEEVLTRLKRLVEAGFVRKVGAVINSKRMGAVSTLAAVEVPDDRVDATAEVINSFHGVTHNYLRDGRPNIWFTLTERNTDTLEENIALIEERIGTRVIRLPATKLYKIGVHLDI